MTGAPIYRQVLGDAFDGLDGPVRYFHSLRGTHRFHGQCVVRGAEHPVGRLVCALFRLPPAADAARFDFDLQVDRTGETWTRRFPGRSMRSRLTLAPGPRLRERIGPACLEFSLSAADGRLSMHLERIRLLGLTWPRRWFPTVWAFEWGAGMHFHFDVGARLRWPGLLVAYSGYLALHEMGGAP